MKRNPWENKFVPYNFGSDPETSKIATYLQVALMGVGLYFLGKKLYDMISRFGMAKRG